MAEFARAIQAHTAMLGIASMRVETHFGVDWFVNGSCLKWRDASAQDWRETTFHMLEHRPNIDGVVVFFAANDVIVLFDTDREIDPVRTMASACVSTESRVHVQWEKFVAELPELIRRHAGRWAVYMDGLRHVCDDEDAALEWAYANLPHDAGFVIAVVETPRVTRVRW